MGGEEKTNDSGLSTCFGPPRRRGKGEVRRGQKRSGPVAGARVMPASVDSLLPLVLLLVMPASSSFDWLLPILLLLLLVMPTSSDSLLYHSYYYPLLPLLL